MVLVSQVLRLFLRFRFLVENKSKKSGEKESSSSKEQSSTEKDKEKGGKGEAFNASFSDFKDDKVLPFFEAGEEEFLKSHGLKEHKLDDDGDSKPTLTSRDIFGKWGDEPKYSTSYPSFKEKSRRDVEDEDSLEHMEEELYRSRKHSSKKEEKSKKKEKKDKEKSRRSPSPAASREKERPLFPSAAAAAAAAAHQDSPVHHLSSTREEFELKITSLEDMPRYGRDGYANTHMLLMFTHLKDHPSSGITDDVVFNSI